MIALVAATWPRARAGEALEALGHAAGLTSAAQGHEVPAPPADLDPGGGLARWLETTAAWLGVDAEPVSASYVEVDALVRGAGPALLEVTVGDDVRFVALLRGGRRTITILDETRTARRLPAAVLRDALRGPLARGVAGELDRVLAGAVPPRRRARARAALLRERVGAHPIGGCWILRHPAGTDLGALARRARLAPLLGGMLAARGLEFALVLLAWWAVARGAFQGRLDPGWLAAWFLLLATQVPCQILGAWCASRLSIAAGILLKTRLLAGVLRLDPNEIRHQGVGQLLGRVIESSAIEALGIGGGLQAAVAVLELGLCLGVLGSGAGGLVHVALLAGCGAVVALAGLRAFARRSAWAALRMAMTHDLIERMVGHRTRLAQEPHARWHDGEDQALERYLAASGALDRATLALTLVPRAWLLVGIAGLVPVLVVGSPSAGALAIALGGVLLGQRALRSLTDGVASLAGAAVAWRSARPLVDAAARVEVAATPAPTVASTGAARTAGALLLDAHDLRFGFRERGEPVLRGCSLRVRLGDRILLEGPSGAGKSTLAALLAGLRVPASGFLLLGGLDRHALGAEGWRRRVVAAPQFHENHVFSSTFGFNLLMGRVWPPRPGDLAEAEAICRELDLGALLDRMPDGLEQIVGETGWQLSHGERSRLYIARALLQDADLVVLDESFAALDPETLRRALACVRARARTLLVIAHP